MSGNVEIIEHGSDDDDARTEVMVRAKAPQALLDASEAASWTPRMVITVDDAVAMIDERDEFMKRVLRMVKDAIVVIPGANRPALGKPGAERLLTAYGLHPSTEDEAPPVIDLLGSEHGGEPFIQFRRRCTIWRQTGPHEDDRMRVSSLSGECNSWETKYRYRESKRRCPVCDAETIIRGKKEYGGGWICFKKQGGCGAKFGDTDTRIVSQSVGRTANPDVADQLNTILKMADKRALVAATIAATGWSDMVTQDLEDHANPPPSESAPPEQDFGLCPGCGESRVVRRKKRDGEIFLRCSFSRRGDATTCQWRADGEQAVAIMDSGRAEVPPTDPSKDDGDVDPESVPF